MLFWDSESQRKRIGSGLSRRMDQILSRGEFILGPEVQFFEDALAALVGAPEAVSCASGTDALLLSLLAHEVGPGDAVFLPAFTFIATAGAVVRSGATPVFVDVGRSGYCIDKESFAVALNDFESRSSNDGLRAAALIAVDLFGVACDYEELRSLTEPRGMLLLADAAQSLGAAKNGQAVGTLAACTATSFFPTKPLGCYGDGGAVLCTERKIATRIRELRSQGRREGRAANVGFNSRLDTLQAGVLLEKLGIFEEERGRREEIASHYGEALGDLVDLPFCPPGSRCAWAQYTITLRGEFPEFPQRREQVLEGLRRQGVPARVYYDRPLHREPAYSRWSPVEGALRRTDELCHRVLSLPIHPYLNDLELSQVVEALRKVLV